MLCLSWWNWLHGISRPSKTVGKFIVFFSLFHLLPYIFSCWPYDRQAWHSPNYAAVERFPSPLKLPWPSQSAKINTPQYSSYLSKSASSAHELNITLLNTGPSPHLEHHGQVPLLCQAWKPGLAELHQAQPEPPPRVCQRDHTHMMSANLFTPHPLASKISRNHGCQMAIARF